MRTVRTVAAVTAVAVFASASLLGCQSDDALFEEIAPADELWEQAQDELEGMWILGIYPYTDYDEAIEILQSIVDNYPYSEYAVRSELQIADAYYEGAKYEEALSYYRDFADLHPQHPRVPYALWRAARCHEKRVLVPERDQGFTRDAIGFLDRLLLQYPRSEYTERAEEMWRELQTRLAENVEAIADFYYSRGEYEAAAERYRALLNEYPGLGLDARVLYRLGECYAQMQRLDEADRIFRTLVAQYADSEPAYRARQHLPMNAQRTQ